MAKTINSRPDAVAHLPRHGHNLSHDFAFTSPVGYLLPVEHDFLFPGDSVSLDFSLNTITNPLEKPCMSGITEHIDVFFVPLRKLRTVAPEVITNVDDLPTSFVTSQQVKNAAWVFPTASLRDYGALAEGLIEASIHDAPSITRAVELTKEALNGELLPNLRLLEHLGYNPDIFTDENQSWRADDYQPQVSLMMLCAYQAIFYDYYRLSNFFENKVRAYNLDFADITPVTYELYSILELHRRPYKRDYFKNIEPSPLQNSLGVLFDAGSRDNFLNQWLSSTDYPVFDSTFHSADSESTQVQTGSDATTTVSIRTAFAFEKLLRVSQRAGKHYDDQVLAHFGVKVDKGIANEVYYLGSHQQKIDFGMVVSQASTEDSPLGNLAGRGYSVNNKNNRTIKFKAPCHGVLMAIYSAEPDLMYHTGLDKIHTMSDIYDFPLPEFDKLGMQPLFGYERRAALDFASERLGWQFRYANFKQRYDRCTYAFTNHVYGHAEVDGYELKYGLGAYAPYVISDQNSHLLSSSNRYRNSLIIDPNDTDQIFLLGYDPSISLNSEWVAGVDTGDMNVSDLCRAFLSSQYTSDPLIHKLGIRYFKSSWMSTFGEPDL